MPISFDDLPEVKKSEAITFDDLPDVGQDMGVGRSALQGFNSAVPFGNRLTAGLGALGAAAVTGENVGDLYNEARANQSVTEQANPTAYNIGMAGGLVNTLPAVFSSLGNKALTSLAAPEVITNAGNALQKGAATIGNWAGSGNLAGRVVKGAAANSAIGSLYGAGSADNIGEGAAQGAILGGAIGGSIPIAGKVLGGAVGYGADKVASMLGKNSGEISKESLSAPLQKVFDRLRADYPDQQEFQSILASLGSSRDKALIESAGARTTNLAKGVAQYPSGEAKSTEFFQQATDAAPDKLKSTLSKTVSPSTNYSDDVDSLLEAGRAKASPLYTGAFKSNQSVSSPVISKILQTPEGKVALNEAVANMQNELALVAKPDPELTQMVRELSDIGLVDPQVGGVASGLKLKTLDYVKRAMDKTITKAYSSGDIAQAERIKALKNGLIGELDSADKTGLYAKARSTSGDYLSTKQAMEDGLNFLKDDAENISRRMSNMGSAEKDAYRAGVVKVLRNDIDNKFDGQNVARLFDKASNRSKLKDLLSGKDYAKLIDDAKAADNIYKLRNQIVGGSPTAGKQIAAQEFQNGLQDIAMDVATGNPLSAGYKAAKTIVTKMFDGISDKSAGEVADILYTKDPKEKYRIIKSLLNESQKYGGGLRATEAGQKLKAFYALSDGLKSIGGSSIPQSQGANLPSNKLSITVTPPTTQKRP